MKAELVPLDGNRPIRITRDITVVGRRSFCDVVIDNPSLSKRHCVLIRTEGLLMIRDLITTNGTKVNGQRVMWAALLPNDRVTLGKCKFSVYLGSDDAPSPSELRGGTAQEHPTLGTNGSAETPKPAAVPEPAAAPAPKPAPRSEVLIKLDDARLPFRLADLDEDDQIPLIDLD